MLGTGLYIDDVIAQSAAANSTLKTNIEKTFVFVAMITLPAVIAVFLTGLLLNLRERRMADVKLHNLTQRIIDTQEEERTRITVKLNSAPFKNLLPPDAKTALYRIAQEALYNIERHASASKVTIGLTSRPSGLRMTISDNGKGFEKQNKPTGKGGLGLRNMQERISHFSGTLTVDSSSTGTILTARLPRSILRTSKSKTAPAKVLT